MIDMGRQGMLLCFLRSFRGNRVWPLSYTFCYIPPSVFLQTLGWSIVNSFNIASSSDLSERSLYARLQLGTHPSRHMHFPP